MWLTEESMAEGLFHIIPILHDRLIKPFEGIFREDLSPMQFYTLAALHRNGCMTMTELACHFGIPKQQMTKIVNHLVEIEVAVRKADSADRRLVKICITGRAKEYIIKYQREVCSQIGLTLEQLDSGEKQELFHAMHTINTILPRLSFQNKGDEAGEEN